VCDSLRNVQSGLRHVLRVTRSARRDVMNRVSVKFLCVREFLCDVVSKVWRVLGVNRGYLLFDVAAHVNVQ